jgi:signal peptidase I
MYLIDLLIYAILFFGLLNGVIYWKGFVKANRKAWEAFIPFYNIVIQLKIIERPWWWLFLLVLPVIGNIILIVMVYEWLHVFGYRKKRHTAYAFLSLFGYLIYVNYKEDTKYIGRDNELMIKSVSTWTSALLFAIVAATAVHTYFMQPYVIPTPSLEKSLLVGDFLFVSKFHYGVRAPMTPIALPMVHDAIPFTKFKSYTTKLQLPYLRFPGIQKIKRNDIVVFSWPTDTLVVPDNPNSAYRWKPIDKKSNYVKRCVGIAGDTLSIKDGYVYINGSKNELPDRARLQFSYGVLTKGQSFNQKYMHDRYDLDPNYYGFIGNNTYQFTSLTDETAAALKIHSNVVELKKNITPAGQLEGGIFPNDNSKAWNRDQFGPIYIPEQGKSIALNMDNLPIYKQLITEYEHNTLEVNGNQIKINGEIATSYTFKQDYYWMQGDNRHNSLDSRYWGFVPFDHVVGKPVFIWMSFDNSMGFSPRWDRFFTTVGGSGARVSYLSYFLVVLGLWIGIDWYLKKRRKQRS